jgi:hypothetical protein
MTCFGVSCQGKIVAEYVFMMSKSDDWQGHDSTKSPILNGISFLEIKNISHSMRRS